MERLRGLTRQSGTLIGPSLLAADFANLKESIGQVEAEMDFLHFDVMDGHFVPQLSFGAGLCRAIRPLTEKAIDVHLMVTNPTDLIPDFAAAGADMISVHVETMVHGHRVLEDIRSRGMAAGLVLNPMTPLLSLEEYLPYLDFVLLMSVNPGYGGQKFIGSMLDKLSRLRQMIDRSGHDILIEIDGGICLDNIRAVAESGADLYVAGSAVFGAADPSLAIRQLKAEAEEMEEKICLEKTP